MRAFNHQQRQSESAEESKSEPSADETAKLEARVAKIVDSLSVKKPAARAGGFRSFMKTQKTELKQM